MVINDLARVHATQTLHMSRVCASRDCSLLVWYAAQQPTHPPVDQTRPADHQAVAT